MTTFTPNSTLAVPAEIMGLSSVEPLAKFLHHPNSRYRMAAAQRLGQLRDPSAVPPLVAAIKNEPAAPTADGLPTVESAAIQALGSIGTPEAREAVMATVNALLRKGPKLKRKQDPVYYDARYYGQITTGVAVLGQWADDPDTRLLLESLAGDPSRWLGKIEFEVQVEARVHLLRAEMRQRRIGTQDDQVRYLLARVTGPRFQHGDWFAPGLLTPDAVNRVATLELLDTYGPTAAAAVEAELKHPDNMTPERAEALRGILFDIRERPGTAHRLPQQIPSAPGASAPPNRHAQ